MKKKYIIPSKDFVKILTDIHISDAMLVTYDIKKEQNIGDSVSYYGPILEQYGYTRQQLDSTLVYYSEHPHDYDKIYQMVLNSLSRIEGDLNKIEEEEAQLKNFKNLWNRQENWSLPQDGDKNTIDFNVGLEGPGIYTIRAEILVYSDDQSLNPHLTASFVKQDSAQSDESLTLKSDIFSKDGRYHTIMLKKNLDKDMDFTHLKGSILDHDTKEGAWKKHAEIKNVRIYYDPGEEKENP